MSSFSTMETRVWLCFQLAVIGLDLIVTIAKKGGEKNLIFSLCVGFKTSRAVSL